MMLVDRRGGSAEYAPGLRKQGISVDVTTLDSADMAFIGNGPNGVSVDVGVELKKMNDLGTSLRTGRLNGDQFVKMQQAYEQLVLLVEGEFSVSAEGLIVLKGHKGKDKLLQGWTAVELQKRLYTLQFVAHVPIIFTQNKRQTLLALTSLYRWWTDKDFEEHRSHMQIKRSQSFFSTTQFVKTIETLPGVGIAVAKAAERKFGRSIRRAVNADTATWAELQTVNRSGKTKTFGNSKAVKVTEALK